MKGEKVMVTKLAQEKLLCGFHASFSGRKCKHADALASAKVLHIFPPLWLIPTAALLPLNTEPHSFCHAMRGMR